MTTNTALHQSFEQHRRRLWALAYRMTGSAAAAEDLVQDAWVKAAHQTVVPDQPAAWWTTVVTRLCLDHLRSAQVARVNYVGQWLPEPVLDTVDLPASPRTGEEHVDLRESLSMALLLVLETLSPVERAVFLLREVFEHPYDEIATMLGLSPEACRQHHHRARGHVGARKRRFHAPDERSGAVTAAFLEAVSNGDEAALVKLLAPDAVFISDGGGRVKAALNVVRSADHVARFVLGVMRKFPTNTSYQPALLNGAPALVGWLAGVVHVAVLLDVDAVAVHGLHVVLNPDKLRPLQHQLVGLGLAP